MRTVDIEDFIHDIRTDREREKAEYKQKGYIVTDDYLCLSKINVVCNGKEYSYNVQADKNEIRFFISNNNANLHLSIPEIYDVLRALPNSTRALFISAFNKHLSKDVNTACHFNYQGIIYDMSSCVDFSDGIINLDQFGLEIECVQLYYLIHLFQEKSNSMFARSTDEQKANINGIYRLYSALLQNRGESVVLYDKGWLWDSSSQKYILDTEQRGRDIKKWKSRYYLKDSEYKTILGIKKS